DVVVRRPFHSLERDVRTLLLLSEALKELRERVAHRVLRGERDEEELVSKRAELGEGDRIRVVEPLERARPVEGELRGRETSAEMSALPAMWPQRFGRTWSSMCAPATPAFTYSSAMRWTLKRFP